MAIILPVNFFTGSFTHIQPGRSSLEVEDDARDGRGAGGGRDTGGGEEDAGGVDRALGEQVFLNVAFKPFLVQLRGHRLASLHNFPLAGNTFVDEGLFVFLEGIDFGLL